MCTTPAGIPLASFLSEPIKIIQSPRLPVIIHESDNTFRQIYTDGRGFPKEFDFPAYMGYSVGRWEGDTLVVETAGFNDKTRLDLIGHPHSIPQRTGGSSRTEVSPALSADYSRFSCVRSVRLQADLPRSG